MTENKDDLIEEYDDEPITLTDEDGVSTDFEYLDSVEYDGKEYAILAPVCDDENAQLDTVIFEIVPVDEEFDDYIPVDDSEVEYAVFEIFKAKNADSFNFVD